MALASKLCNPTPFKVELPWHRGISIHVEPFGSAELTMQQMDDYRPGKPGSEKVRLVLEYYGLFLLDADRPYDNQALEALERSYKAKKTQYDEAVQSFQKQRAQSGIAPNEDALEETLRQMGLVGLREQVEQLKKAISKFKSVVGEKPERSMRPQFDPARTVMCLDPPREFPSVAAMEFFLDSNPDIKAKHVAFKSQKSNVPSPHQQITTLDAAREK